MSGDGYAFDPEAAKRVEKGLRDAISELNELGLDIEAQMGRGFSRLQLSDVEVGHAGLRSVFEDFCERWGWGVRGKIQDADDIAAGLGLSAGLYHEQEQYVSGTLKQAVNAGMGDPGLSAEQVERRSWGETLKDNSVTDFTDPDFTPPTPEELRQMKQPWEQAGQAWSTSPMSPGMGQDTDWQWDGAPEAEGSDDGQRHGDGGN